MGLWSKRTGVTLHFIQPGKPVQNAYVESFNGRFRDACLNQHWFADLGEARRLTADWRHHYNHVRPHSSLGYVAPATFLGKVVCDTMEFLSMTVALIQGEGHKSLHFVNEQRAIQQFRNANTMLLSLDWYGIGRTGYFRWDLAGATDAINNARGICRGEIPFNKGPSQTGCKKQEVDGVTVTSCGTE